MDGLLILVNEHQSAQIHVAIHGNFRCGTCLAAYVRRGSKESKSQALLNAKPHLIKVIVVSPVAPLDVPHQEIQRSSA